MRIEKIKNKIAIVGHTKGIGKAISDLYKKKNYTVVGFSRSNGFDLEKQQNEILEKLDDCRLIVINAYAKKGQLELLKRIYGKYLYSNKKVAVITSTSGTSAGQDSEHTTKTYIEYCKMKKQLIGYISELQQELLQPGTMSVHDICPDTVRTEMSKGLWEDYPKLKATDVAECVDLVFSTNKYNINKIVIQKYAK